MKKYIFLDTDVLINCCLASEVSEDLEVLEKFKIKLERDRFVFVLPEVVELEFNRIVDDRFKKLKLGFDLYLKNLSDQLTPYPGAREKIKKVVRDCGLERRLKVLLNNLTKHFNDAKEVIGKIFTHKKTIRIPISDTIFLSAYRRGVSGKKPYKKPTCLENEKYHGAVVQSDCIVIESLIKFLGKENDYTLFICTHNVVDYASGVKNSGGSNSLPIHPDIKSEFKTVKLYKFLHELLNEEFIAKISAEKLTITKEPFFSLGIVNPIFISSFSGLASSVGSTLAGSQLTSSANSLNITPLGVSISDGLTISPQSLFRRNCQSCGIGMDGWISMTSCCCPICAPVLSVIQTCDGCGKHYHEPTTVSVASIKQGNYCSSCRSRVL